MTMPDPERVKGEGEDESFESSRECEIRKPVFLVVNLGEGLLGGGVGPEELLGEPAETGGGGGKFATSEDLPFGVGLSAKGGAIPTVESKTLSKFSMNITRSPVAIGDSSI